MQVSIKAVAPVLPEVGLPTLRLASELDGLELLKRGSRLSVHPVSPEHWKVLIRMAGFKSDPHAQWLTENGLEAISLPKKSAPAPVTKPVAKKPSQSRRKA
jgi:hypothetical protein